MKAVKPIITLSGYGDEIAPDLEAQLDVLAAEGIRYLDLRSVWDKNVLELTNEELQDIKQRLDQRGFHVHSISSPIGKSPITQDFSIELEQFKRAVEIAKYMGTPNIRIFSFYTPKGESKYKYRDEVINRIGQLTRIAEREGIRLMLENEKGLFGNNGERLRDIFQAVSSPNLRLAFDPANFVQSLVLPMTDAYPKVAPYLSWVQIKDALINRGTVVPAGEGDGQIRMLFRELRNRSYDGFISVESHLLPTGRFTGYSEAQLFVVSAQATKKLLKEAGLKWT